MEREIEYLRQQIEYLERMLETAMARITSLETRVAELERRPVAFMSAEEHEKKAREVLRPIEEMLVLVGEATFWESKRRRER